MSVEFLFILGAIILSAASKIVNKHVLGYVDVYSYTILNNTIGATVFFFLAFFYFDIVELQKNWPILVLAGLLWTITGIVTNISYKQADLSIREPLTNTRVIWVLIFGILFIGEQLTLIKVCSTIIIFFGLAILFWKKEYPLLPMRNRGVIVTLISAIMIAMVSIIDKFSLNYFDVKVYGFFAYVGPVIVLLFGLPWRINLVKQSFKSKFLYTLTGASLPVVTYYFILQSYQRLDITLIYPLLQLGSFVAVIYGIVFLRERENIYKKIVATIIIIFGVILLKFS